MDGYATICLLGHLLMEIWIVSRFGLLQIKLCERVSALAHCYQHLIWSLFFFSHSPMCIMGSHGVLFAFPQ
jgi:hypothetical protein